MAIDARKWVAARMAPHHWGDHVTIEHIGEGDRPASLDMSNLTTEQLEQLSALQRQLTPGAEAIQITADASVETVVEKTKARITDGWVIPGRVKPDATPNLAATG